MNKVAAGSEVVVMSIDQKPLGIGVMLYDYDGDGDDPDRPMPKIKMPDGTFLLGCECWWIPLAEVEKIT